MDFLPFDEARQFVKALNLKNAQEWKHYAKNNQKPENIPYSPYIEYKNKGWVSWGDWLGTGNISPRKRDFLPFDKAREFMHALKLKSYNEWIRYCKGGEKPPNIPVAPNITYRNHDWISYGDWLGISEETFLRFDKAREFVRSLKLKNAKEWKKYCESKRLRPDLPMSPDVTYKNKGWKGWRDWLGKKIDSQSINLLPYDEARNVVHSLNLNGRKEWKQYICQEHRNFALPQFPDIFYKNNGWISWREWLGQSCITKKIKYRSFEEARKFVQCFKFKNYLDWLKYCKNGLKPIDIPSSPNKIYKYDGWKGWGDWLGSGSVCVWRKSFWVYARARHFIHKLEIKTPQEWENYCNSGKKPKKIPSHPEFVYQNKGWKNWEDWFGKIEFRSFEEARKFVHTLCLKNTEAWNKYKKSENIPIDIPHNPNTVYKNQGWISMGDWLGTGVIAGRKKIFRPFEAARKFIRNLNLKTYSDWGDYCRQGNKPEDIPVNPDRVYKNKGWSSMEDWLGAPKSTFRPFEEAKIFIHKLKLKNSDEWVHYCKNGQKPADIPTNVSSAYKNKGWTSWGDWLGTGIISTWHIDFSSFESARKFARSLKFKSRHEWHQYCVSGKRPSHIPSNPYDTYKNKGWKGWGDWLGTGNISNQYKVFRDFESARNYIRSLKLKNFAAWAKYRKSKKKPADIPAAPSLVYAGKGWISYGDWLGTHSISPKHRVFWSYEEAKQFVHTLRLKSQSEWYSYCKIINERPKEIPMDPYKTYKNKGWKNWGDWLGKAS